MLHCNDGGGIRASVSLFKRKATDTALIGLILTLQGIEHESVWLFPIRR